MKAIDVDKLFEMPCDVVEDHMWADCVFGYSIDVICDQPTLSAEDLLGVEKDKILILPGNLTVIALRDMLRHDCDCEGDSIENYTTGFRAGKKAGYAELLRMILGVEKDEVSEDA